MSTPRPRYTALYHLRLCTADPTCEGVALDQRTDAVAGLCCFAHSPGAQAARRRVIDGVAVELPYDWSSRVYAEPAEQVEAAIRALATPVGPDVPPG